MIIRWEIGLIIACLFSHACFALLAASPLILTIYSGAAARFFTAKEALSSVLSLLGWGLLLFSAGWLTHWLADTLALGF